MRTDRPIGKAKTWCSQCGKHGHNRRNRTFHPNVGRLSEHRRGSPGYKAAWRKHTRIRTSMRGTCIDCAGTVDRTDERGNPLPRCTGCKDHWLTVAKAKRADRKRFEAVLRDIATGTCLDPVARAAAVLGMAA